MLMKKWIKVILAVVIVLIISGGAWFWMNRGSAPSTARAAGTYQTPTLFVHGFGGGYGSEKDMIADLSKHPGYQQVLRYTVTNTGQLSVSGSWSASVKHPLIAVVFSGGRPDAPTLGKILKQLKKRYGIKNFNAVGHSAGLAAWANWAVTPDKQGMPQLRRLITIAGPFNGFPGMPGMNGGQHITLAKDGRPNVMSDRYKPLYDNRRYFPKTAAVLNLFGNLGKSTDGRVPVNSARSLRYVVAGRAKSYTDREITNSKAQHSQLHEHNPLVNRYLYEFLNNGKITN
ncbi:alpha/beta hydrolase [Lacticaseibacillus paracasei]|uniref:alpha/beta hydrolase n=1 Tax=Lacticaseibacillus paracasei TaxID=1597 RepID=UPI0034E87D06